MLDNNLTRFTHSANPSSAVMKREKKLIRFAPYRGCRKIFFLKTKFQQCDGFDKRREKLESTS